MSFTLMQAEIKFPLVSNVIHLLILGLGRAGGRKVCQGLQVASPGQSKGRPEPEPPSPGQHCDAGQDCLETEREKDRRQSRVDKERRMRKEARESER